MTWGNRSDHCPGAGKDLKGSVRDKMDQLSFYWAGDVPVDIHQHNSDWPKKDKIISFVSKLFAALICKKDQLCEYLFVIAPLLWN